MTVTTPLPLQRTAAGPSEESGGAARVLVVDDQPRILAVVLRALRLEGIRCEGTTDPQAALRLLREGSHDLLVLDLLMPGLDGFEVLRQVMSRNPEQVVLVLSCLTDPTSKVRSLGLGADDYLAKPFHVDELLARVQARLRVAARARRPTLRCGRLTLDLAHHSVDCGGRHIQLADREFEVLVELVRSDGRPVSKAALLSRVWGYDFDAGSNVVDVCIRRLRCRLGADLIATVRGEGYRVELG